MTPTTNRIMDKGATQQVDKNNDKAMATTTSGITEKADNTKAVVLEAETAEVAETAVVLEAETAEVAETAVVLEAETAEVAETAVVLEAETAVVAAETVEAEAETAVVLEAEMEVMTAETAAEVAEMVLAAEAEVALEAEIAAVEVAILAAAAAAEVELLGGARDDAVGLGDPQIGGATGLGIGGGAAGDEGVARGSLRTMMMEGESEETPDEEQNEAVKTWMEEMEINPVSHMEDPMD
ncbi:unnamed protein product [Lota lota]